MSDTPRTDAFRSGIYANSILLEKFEEMEHELNALRSQQMTEEKAREVLGSVIDKPDYSEAIIGCVYTGRFRRHTIDPKAARLNGVFYAEQLRAIAWWMENMGGVKGL